MTFYRLAVTVSVVVLRALIAAKEVTRGRGVQIPAIWYGVVQYYVLQY